MILVISALLLVSFYLFQKPVMSWLVAENLEGYSAFVFKKGARFIINDVLMVGVIYGLFGKIEYVKIALLVQVLGLIFLLTPYLFLKYHMGSYNGPLLSFLHRLVLNPLLMILLIPALYIHEKSNTST